MSLTIICYKSYSPALIAFLNFFSSSETTKVPSQEFENQSTSKQPRVFKPIQNWHKIMKISSEQPLSKWTVDQIFRNVTSAYAPRVPRNTSDRCIAGMYLYK